MTAWLQQTQQLTSKGQTAAKATSLADLHRRRAETEGQFFTPPGIAARIWEVLTPTVHAAERLVSVLDSSVGSGRLFASAPVEHCAFYGLDSDEDCIAELRNATKGSNHCYTFETGKLEDLDARRFDLAVINPPFSLTLSSPNMFPHPGTSFGPYGPHTSATSHEYALHQALDAARVVAAILPVSMDAVCKQNKRLKMVVYLPSNAFKEEGANVLTAVYFFDARESADAPVTVQGSEMEAWPAMDFSILRDRHGQPRFVLGGVDESQPTITTPVTGNPVVKIDHKGRRLVLGFACGFTEARVLNGLFRRRVSKGTPHRYPDDIQYVGQGRLYLDAFLCAEDPDKAFHEFLSEIADLGGTPRVSATLAGYWRRLKRKHRRAMVPFRHVVKCGTATTLTVTAKRSSMLEPGNLSSPAIRKGTVLEVTPLGGEYQITHQGVSVTINRDELQRRFELSGDPMQEHANAQWVVAHEGLLHAFPDLAHEVFKRIDAAGITWLWPYQRNLVAEALVRGNGAVIAAEQGTGKARMAIALALLSGKGLICVESGLIPEMVRELKALNLPRRLWQVIETVSDTQQLRAVNVISYNRLRSDTAPGVTLAHYLRRRVHTLLADEGSLLRNRETLQSRAVAQVSARRVYVLDGTPMANYPRDLLPLAAATVGDGVAHQPYATRHRPLMSATLLNSAEFCPRGVDAFRDAHVVLDWATHEFKEDMNSGSGAKREIPRINNVVAFRDWTSRFVMRILRDQPDVARYAGCPKPTYNDHVVKWDKRHLALYLETAVDFAQWYLADKDARATEGKGANLTKVLARIQAVMAVANNPHVEMKNTPRSYHPITSKQRAVLARIHEHVEAGRKTIVYCSSPATVERFATELAAAGIQSVVFHGKRDIAKRTAELDAEFRLGPCQVLLSTWVGQRGLNLGMATAEIFYQREWSGSIESQAIARTQRPDQTESVIVDRFHLEGSLDEYMAQVVEWKMAAADAGLDWGDGATEDDVYYHIDHILEQFCHDTLEMSASQAKEALIAA
jgi:predicted RNA methylase